MLLSFDKQQEIKPMSINNRDRYDMLANEVESLEIDQLLGYAFYQAVAANPANYSDLLNGSSFTDAYGNTVNHKGLLYVIAYLNYAKYIGESYVNDTFSGFTRKRLDNSEALSSGDIKRLQLENREIAFNAFALIRMFLNNNKETYPLWNLTSDKKTYKPKFYGVKKTLS